MVGQNARNEASRAGVRLLAAGSQWPAGRPTNKGDDKKIPQVELVIQLAVGAFGEALLLRREIRREIARPEDGEAATRRNVSALKSTSILSCLSKTKARKLRIRTVWQKSQAMKNRLEALLRSSVF